LQFKRSVNYYTQILGFSKLLYPNLNGSVNAFSNWSGPEMITPKCDGSQCNSSPNIWIYFLNETLFTQSRWYFLRSSTYCHKFLGDMILQHNHGSHMLFKPRKLIYFTVNFSKYICYINLVYNCQSKVMSWIIIWISWGI